MALNVTTAVFRPGFNIATASPSLVQWDQGQTLQFEGVELPSAYQVEFTNAVTVQAITMIGNENGVEIPNELLQQSFPITAYIVLHETAEDRETEYWATIYVKARQKPREETPDPEQSSVIDQTIAALQEGVAEAQAASQAVQNMGVEAETLPEGSEATVEKTVDPETGEVTLEFGIPEGRHGATGATPDIQIGTVTTGAPGSQADASITGTREEPRLNLTIPQGPQGDAGVTSVNGKTGAVTLDATDVGAKPASYEAPVSSVNGKTGAVVLDASDVGAKPASYEAPVSSVNGKTGAVVLSASDVGAKPASYEAPVSSVNEKTGAVVLDSEDIRYDSTETYSDGTVGKELGAINSALSSLQSVTEIIDTASGAIASFPDGSGLPMRSLVAQINPVQDLHGQSSPYPAGGGVNKYPNTLTDVKAFNVAGTWNGNSYTYKGLTFTCTSDNNDNIISITVNGTNEASRTDFTLGSVTLPAGSYIVNGCPAPTSGKPYWIGSSASKFSDEVGNGSSFTLEEETTFSPPSQAGLIGIRIAASITCNNVVFKPMIRLSSVTDAAFAPYKNICSISGWTGVSGEVAGVNLFDIKSFATMYPDLCSYDESTGELSVNGADGILFRTGVPTIIPADKIDGGAYISCVAKNVTAINARIRVIFEDGTARDTTGTGTATDWTNIGGQTLRKRIVAVAFNWSQAGTFIIKDLQINFGATASDYEKYQGESISASFPTTVYGGSDDVISGQGTSTMEFFERPLSDAFLVLTYTNTKRYRFSNIFSASVDRAGSISNFAPSAYNADDFVHFYVDGRNCDVFVPVDTDTSMVVQVCAPLSTPQTFTHDPVPVDTLYGQNNIWVDVGAVSVEYPADTKLYIDGIGGTPDEDMIANGLIASGKYFMVNNNLYLSTAQIAAGAMIIPGTNCTATNLVEALNALNT